MTTKDKKISKRAEKLLERLRREKALCARTDQTEEGIHRGGLSFWLEPSGKGCGPATARELIDKGLVAPMGDGLFADTTQSWRLA